MKTPKIGLFDSGRGGRTVEAAIKTLIPTAETIYLADTKNCPYGEKPLPELQKIVVKNTENLLAQGAEIIVVACNTATTQTINYLREKFPNITFVGTEPAIKEACEKSREEASILLLATEGTASAPRTLSLIKTYQKPSQTVKILPCPGLARVIEDKNQTNLQKCLKTLQNAAADFNPDAVILGCTHYPLIRPALQKIFPSATLYDPAPGVARSVFRAIIELPQ